MDHHFWSTFETAKKCRYSEFYWSVFSPNAGKYGPEKLRIWTLFTQCDLVRFPYNIYRSSSLKTWNLAKAERYFSDYTSSITAWKVSKYEVIFGPHFPVFGLNTERNNCVSGHFSSSESNCHSRFLHSRKRYLWEYEISHNIIISGALQGGTKPEREFFWLHVSKILL